MDNSKAHSELVNRVLLKIGSLPYCRVWKNATGAYQDERGLWVKYGLPGSADITGILTLADGHGVRLEIEIKTGAGRQSEKQVNFEKMIVKMGGLYLVCRHEDEALRFIETKRKGEQSYAI